MFYAQSENKYITEGNAFELDGIKYPAVWLNESNPTQKAQIGLVEVVATNTPQDERFYWVSSTLNGAELTYVNTPKQLDDTEELDESGKLVKTTGLKTVWKQQINQIAYSLLFTSDWMVVRAAEGTPVPQEWSDYRKAIRDKANSIRNQIDMAFDIGSFVAVVTDIQWPHDPNYVAPVEDPVTPVVK